MENLFEQITNNKEKFTKQQMTFADYVLKNANEIAFLNVADAAKQSKVSGATIVRFCKTLGFKGYPDFAKQTQQLIQSDLSAFNRYKLRSILGKDIGHHPEKNSIFHKLLQNEISNTVNLLENINKKSYVACLDLMVKADRFCILGSLASSPLAMYLGQNLSKLNFHTDILYDSSITSFSAMEKLSPDSVVFLISFPRYPREALKLGKYAKKKGAKVIVITDTAISPAAAIADISFFIPLNLLSFGESYTSPIAFLTVLCAEYSNRLPKGTAEKLQRYDECSEALEFFN